MNFPSSIDPNDSFIQHVVQRLQDEQVIWLTTIGHDGLPQPRPVWFWWDGETLIIYTMPNAAKVKHIQRDPRVALNFESGHDGEDVVVFHGHAWLDSDPVPSAIRQAYLTKYAAGIAYINMTPESLTATFNTVIRVKPEKVRGGG